MPSSRYTPSAYGDIDSGGWDNPPPQTHNNCKIYRGTHLPIHPRNDSWGHDICQRCGDFRNNSSNVDHDRHQNHNHHQNQTQNQDREQEQEQPRGRGQMRAPSIENNNNDNWAPAPVRNAPVKIEPPKLNGGGDDWGSSPALDHQPANDADGWGVPTPAPPPPAPRSNGNGNNFSAPSNRDPKYRSTSRYDDEEEEYNEEDEIIPPPSTDPVHGAYVAWTGVTYSDPSKNVADPPSMEELLEVLEPMRLERERKQAIKEGLAPPTRPPRGAGQDNGYGDRAGGDGDGYGGGGYGGGSRNCYNCDQPGHISADCTEEKKPRGGGGGGGACYSCGEDGHQSRDCPSKTGGGGGGGGCFNCGQDGHFSRECPNERVERSGGGGGGGGTCYNCDEDGHFISSRECTNEKVEKDGYGGGSMLCYNCGEEGHMSRDCVNERVAGAGGGGGTCYNCGESGHMSRECTEPPVPGSFRGECHNCGERGHQSRDCEKPRVPGSFRGECHNCGEVGHQSRECGKPRNYDRAAGGGGSGGDAGYGNGGGGGGGDWGEPAATVWGEERTPGLVADTSASDDWGSPQVIIQTPAQDSGFDRQKPPATKNEDDWGTPSPAPAKSNDDWGTPSPAPAIKNKDDWGTPSPAPAQQEPPAAPRAAPGIHPSRLAMLGGKGAAAEYASPVAQMRGPAPRKLPPHMSNNGNSIANGNGHGNGNGNGNGYESARESHSETPRNQEPKVVPLENNEFGGW